MEQQPYAFSQKKAADNVLVAVPTSKSQAELGKNFEAEALDSLSTRRNLQTEDEDIVATVGCDDSDCELIFIRPSLNP